MCEISDVYPYSSGLSKDAFIIRPCQNTSPQSHAFKEHANSNCYQCPEKKLTTNGASVNWYQKINLNKEHVNYYVFNWDSLQAEQPLQDKVLQEKEALKD